MYNFLGLVNDINSKMNEVPLTELNLSSASGFYSDAKNAVNYALDTINRVNWEWPFNHITKELPLVVDQVRYSFEANTKSINWYSFRIKGDDTLQVKTTSLWPMDYEDYLSESSDMEYRPSIYHAVPEVVFRTPELKFGIIPPPNKEYVMVYEYYSLPFPLINWDDVPTVPEFFRHVINDGSIAQAFRFRGDVELASDYEQRFQDGIERMRSIYVNRNEYVSNTMRRK